MSGEALLDVVPTIQFGRKRTLHGVRLGIDENRVYLATKCGVRTDEGEGEFTTSHGVVTCVDCAHAAEVPA
jgi:hypothetical protein